jgi:hypothetical protein
MTVCLSACTQGVGGAAPGSGGPGGAQPHNHHNHHYQQQQQQQAAAAGLYAATGGLGAAGAGGGGGGGGPAVSNSVLGQAKSGQASYVEVRAPLPAPGGRMRRASLRTQGGAEGYPCLRPRAFAVGALVCCAAGFCGWRAFGSPRRRTERLSRMSGTSQARGLSGLSTTYTVPVALQPVGVSPLGIWNNGLAIPSALLVTASPPLTHKFIMHVTPQIIMKQS